MGYKTDIEIAQECEMKPITEIAAKAGIDDKYLEQYGKYKAKIDYNLLRESDAPDGKLILMTAINPTPAGEGKTTTTVGLADALQKMGKKVMVALREPSLGPVFGVKGGAAGGGYAQVVPMEDINLHFTGDFHAIGAANNLLAAMIDNHIFQGNALNIDPRKITWKRCVDMNDRQLRNVVDGLGGKTNGMPREDGYDITCYGDIVAVFSRHTISLSAESVYDITKLTVVHIYTTFPGDLSRVNVQSISLEDVVVDHGCQQVVSCADGMEVTGKVQVNIFHRNYLCVSAAGCSTFHTENRS